jgi:hypothetical protein
MDTTNSDIYMVHDVKTYTNVIAHKLLQKETTAINYYNNKLLP